MSPRSHLSLSRRQLTTAAAGRCIVPGRRDVLRVSIFPYCCIQTQPLCFLVYQVDVYKCWFYLEVPLTLQFKRVHGYSVNLFVRRTASCPHTHIYL